MADVVRDLFEARRVIGMTLSAINDAIPAISNQMGWKRRRNSRLLMKLRQAKAIAKLALYELDSRSGADYEPSDAGAVESLRAKQDVDPVPEADGA